MSPIEKKMKKKKRWKRKYLKKEKEQSIIPSLKSLQVRSMKITLHFAFYKINAIKEKKETERKREENIRLQEWKGNDPR